MTRGFYVMGQHTSVAWFPQREPAEAYCKQLNVRGGGNYRVEEQALPQLPDWIDRDLRSWFEENQASHGRQSFEEWLALAERKDLVDAWLTWNGILGYAGTILELVSEVGMFLRRRAEP